MPEVEYRAPGPGVWELEQTHFAKPVTRYAADAFPDALSRGFAEGTKRYGLLLDTLRMTTVNDFIYGQFLPVGAPPGAKGPPPKLIFQILMRLHPELRRRTATAPEAFTKKLWREDLRRWDEEVKPDSIRRNQKLQRTNIEALGDAEFVGHLNDLRKNQQEMIYRHHIFTIPSSFAVGHYLVEGKRMTGLPSGELLSLLRGSTPVSRGVAEEELKAVLHALQESAVKADRFRGMAPADAIAELRSMPEPVGPALERFLDSVSYRMVTGYDVCEQYAIELPEMLMKTLFQGLSRADSTKADQARLDRVRAKVPERERAHFDEVLGEARFINRLRDERGMYNDIWGAGLARRGMLEAGRRLKANGVLPDAELAISASNDELIALLGGAKEPSAQELQRRQTWRDTKTTSDAPAYLGGSPSGPPPVEWLPAKARPNAMAIGMIIGEMFDVQERNVAPKTVEGLPVHPGMYEGPARLVTGPQDFSRIQQGDVLVTRATGPSFNVVLPLLGAIVTDRGGQLCHAAIVAREYGIPCVVGTMKATATFPDGARVRVDGDKGKVELIA